MYTSIRKEIKTPLSAVFVSLAIPAFCQSTKDVYVDKQGVLRWQKGNTEANFFG